MEKNFKMYKKFGLLRQLQQKVRQRDYFVVVYRAAQGSKEKILIFIASIQTRNVVRYRVAQGSEKIINLVVLVLLL